jgi:Eco57I restriction-modification methylase
LNLISTDFLSDFSFDKRSDNKRKKKLQLHLYFDYIVGNPPFHDDFGQSSKGKRINGGKNKLYERIFIKSYDLLKDKGSIAFIVPDNIFAGNTSAAYKILINNDVPIVSFQRDSRVFFPGIQQPFCYFLMNKGNNKKINTKISKTMIETDNDNDTDTNTNTNNNERFEVVLKDRPVNPVRNWTPYTEKLVTTFVSNKRNKVVYNRGKALTEYKGTKYPIIYTASQKLATGDKELAVGWGQPKAVLFLISPTFAFEMDYKGRYGVGPNTLYIPFDAVSQGKKIERFLNSEEYKVLADATQTSRQYLKIALIEYLLLDKIVDNKRLTRRVNKLVKRNTKRKRIY